MEHSILLLVSLKTVLFIGIIVNIYEIDIPCIRYITYYIYLYYLYYILILLILLILYTSHIILYYIYIVGIITNRNANG